VTAVRPTAPPARADGSGSSADLAAEVSAFLAAEAHLLDDRDYERWLEMFTLDCLYWMPVDPLAISGALRLNVIYDDRARLRDRVGRLTSGSAFSEDPPTLTARTIGTVHLVGGAGTAAEPFVVRSTFSLVAHRCGQQRHLAGRYGHRLVREGSALRIAEKRVGLLGSDSPQRPMAFLF